jgi:Putative Flp pilus-assembly TadE/G-like
MLVVGRAEIKLRMPWQEERGQTLILVVFAMPLMIALVALVADGSNLFANKRSVQNVADATALAVARDIPRDGTPCTSPCPAMQSDAIDYSNRNNGPTVDHPCADSADTNCYLTPYKGNSSVQIRVTRTVSTFIAGFIGLSSSAVRASAAVTLGGSPSAVGNVSPLGLDSSLWSPSLIDGPASSYTLDFDQSNFALFDLSHVSTAGPFPAGTSCNRVPGNAPSGGLGMNRDIAFGYPGDGSSVVLPANAWYCGNTGNKNGMKNGVDYAYNNHIILLVPVFNQVFTTSGGSPVTSYHVIGFAAFSIDQPPPNWNNNTHYIVGHFTTFIATGVSGGPPGGPNDFGVRVITLDE